MARASLSVVWIVTTDKLIGVAMVVRWVGASSSLKIAGKGVMIIKITRVSFGAVRELRETDTRAAAWFSRLDPRRR
jgi:hypothetical protein